MRRGPSQFGTEPVSLPGAMDLAREFLSDSDCQQDSAGSSKKQQAEVDQQMDGSLLELFADEFHAEIGQLSTTFVPFPFRRATNALGKVYGIAG